MDILQKPIVRDVTSEQAPYRGFAFTQMGILKAYMKLAKLDVYSRVVKLANGVVITCKVCFSREDIHIYVPPIIPVVTEEIVEEYVLVFHVLADGKHWGLTRSKSGRWEKILLPKQWADDNTVLTPWGYRHTWFSADKKRVITNGGPAYNGRYFRSLTEYDIPTPSYSRIGTQPWDDELRVGNVTCSTLNSVPLETRVSAYAALDSEEVVSLYLNGSTLTLSNVDGSQSATLSIWGLMQTVYVPADLGYSGAYTKEAFKFSPSGLKFVGMIGTSVLNKEKNVVFTLDLAGIEDLSEVTNDNLSMELLGDAYSRTDLIEPISLYYDGVYKGYTASAYGFGIYHFKDDVLNSVTSYDYSLTGDLIEVVKSVRVKRDEYSMSFGTKVDGDDKIEAGLKDVDNETETFITVNGIDIFRSPIATTIIETISTKTYSNTLANNVPFPITFFYSYEKTAKEDCFEVFDFDARFKNLGLIAYGEVTTASTTLNRSIVKDYRDAPYFGPAEFSADEINTAIAAGTTITTTATEHSILNGASVSTAQKVSQGGMSIPAEPSRPRKSGVVYFCIDRAKLAVRFAASSAGDILYWSPLLQGLNELHSTNFPVKWQDDGKQFFATLVDRNGVTIDPSLFKFTEIQRIGLCEGLTLTTPKQGDPPWL